jgi:isoamylase
VNERGEPVIGDSVLVLLNAHTDKVPFTLPPLDVTHQWRRVIDTFDPHSQDKSFRSGARYPLQGRSVAVFKVTPPIKDRRRAIDFEQTPAAEPITEPATIEG